VCLQSMKSNWNGSIHALLGHMACRTLAVLSILINLHMHSEESTAITDSNFSGSEGEQMNCCQNTLTWHQQNVKNLGGAKES
jgi:hypothetical protein